MWHRASGRGPRAGFRAGGVEVPVKAPFGGGTAAAAGFSPSSHEGYVFGLQPVVGHAGRGMRKPSPQRALTLPGRAGVEAGGGHGPGGGDEAGGEIAHRRALAALPAGLAGEGLRGPRTGRQRSCPTTRIERRQAGMAGRCDPASGDDGGDQAGRG